MHPIRFRPGLRPDPTEFQLNFRGPTSKGKERGGEGRGRGREREGRGGEGRGRGREGKGRGRPSGFAPPPE